MDGPSSIPSFDVLSFLLIVFRLLDCKEAKSRWPLFVSYGSEQTGPRLLPGRVL